ncbi:MFS transporter [Micromonospora krabiensis]|uniref:Predicted arabinose efflux permease, MFS family n=1 Tax=Micromonospora krabiensis TaxID=307121 RepID=A0A1C3MYK4_9ACTN|nr:MFS transporter [Micromonospora krabiensis]SBV25399.1 Predicted arabinose efflux permease, MFS family [Micromonospora krabiensis]
MPAAAPRRSFTALWASQAFSNLADGLLQAAAPLLVATLTRDPLLVAGMTVVQFLPWLLATLPAGALADRVDRRRILTAGNWLRAAGFALLALALTAGWRHVALLYAAVFLAGCAETMVDNAALAIPPRLLPRERLERANGRLFATQSVINTFVGPPAGAALFALAASAAFYTGAAAFALAGLAALLLPALRPAGEEAQRRRSTPTSFTQDIRVGWVHFWRHQLLRRVAFISAAINFFGSVTGGVLVLLATGPYQVPMSRYGLFVAVPAAGAIVGSLLAEHVVPRIGGGPTTWLAALVPAASYAILGLGHHTPLALAGMFCAAVASSLNQIVVSTLRQAAVPDELLGRVTAAYRLVVLGVIPLGALAGGLLGRGLGIRAPFIAAAVGLVLVTLPLAARVTTQALRDAETTHGATARSSALTAP